MRHYLLLLVIGLLVLLHPLFHHLEGGALDACMYQLAVWMDR